MNFIVSKEIAAIVNDERTSFIGPVPEDFQTKGEHYFVSIISRTLGGSIMRQTCFDVPIIGTNNLREAATEIFSEGNSESPVQRARWYVVKLRARKMSKR